MTGRRRKSYFLPDLSRGRNVIERIKAFCKITKRYDGVAHNVLAAVCLAALIFYRK